MKRTLSICTLTFVVALAASKLRAQTPAAFVAVTPCRVVDTRNPNGTFGGPYMPGGQIRSFPIPSGPCPGIAANVTAYSFNVTVVPHGALQYLTVYPTGLSQRPGVSTLNSFNGQIVANAAIVPAGTEGQGSVSVYVTDDTDVIIDINGYFMPQMVSTDAEVPSGTTNGINPVFKLANTPAAGTTPLIARNGIVLKPALDYTIAGNTITFSNGAMPQTGDVLLAWYRHY